MTSAVPLVCSVDLWNPQAAITEHNNQGIVQELVLVKEEKDKAHVDGALQSQQLAPDEPVVLELCVVMTFENLLDQPHFKDEALKEESTCWKA